MQASPFEALFARLAQSNFRSRFRLGPKKVACIERRGMAVIRRHAEGFVRRRLAPAFIPQRRQADAYAGHPFSSLSMPQPAAAAFFGGSAPAVARDVPNLRAGETCAPALRRK